MVAIPPVMRLMSSERVMVLRKGLTSNGASVCPRKMLPAADKLSAPEMRNRRRITVAKNLTTFCKMP